MKRPIDPLPNSDRLPLQHSLQKPGSRHRGLWLTSTILTSLTTSLLVCSPARAVQLQDGTTYFVGVPQLVEAVTTSTAADTWSPTYYFTIKLPDNAGEPLESITIAQSEGVDSVHFLPDQVTAFVGTRRSPGDKIPLSNVQVNNKDGSLTLHFSPSIPPGQTLTLEVVPAQNPSIEGVYLFSLTAFPQGEKPHGQFLGYGRFNIYRHGGGFWHGWR